MKKVNQIGVFDAVRNKIFTLCLLLMSSVMTSGQLYAAAPYFSDGLEWASTSDAIQNGPWSRNDGNASISTQHAHSGNKSLKVCYGGNESQAFLAFKHPVTKGLMGLTSVVLGWWEYRATDYDWSGEKFNRVVGRLPNGNVSLDYPLGWVAKGGWGQPGTNDAGVIQMFGNSIYSNGATHFSYNFPMKRGEWHFFEYEITLNDIGVSNGVTRLWIDHQLVAEIKNLELRYDNSHTIDEVWMGGWYSGGVNPSPSPACRYIDDVTLTLSRQSVAPPNPPIPN